MTRVELAYHEHFDFLKNELSDKKIEIEQVEIFLRAFKNDELLELWAKNRADDIFINIRGYNFCASSGTLGPKRKEGDGQIPEGFYHVDRFNPKSKFHLSLGLNYPNVSDLVLGNKKEPGGDIFIHGGCASIGCIPITDEKIKEVYVLASEAMKNGQVRIPVHIFPFKMTDENLAEFGRKHQHLLPFWKNLQSGFKYFEKNKKCPVFTVLGNGLYQFG